MDKAREIHRNIGFNPFAPKNQVTDYRDMIFGFLLFLSGYGYL